MKSNMENNHNISYSVYNDFNHLSDVQVEWDQLVEMTAAGIFLTYDWCRIWWKYYNKKRKAYIFLFRKDTQLVGLVPMFIEKLGFGLINITIGKVIGSDHTLTICNPAVINTNSIEIYDIVIDYLHTNAGCDMVIFGPTLETNQYQINNKHKNINRIISDINILYNLPDNFEEYMKSLSKSERKHYKNNYNKLTNEYNIKFELSQNINDAINSFEDFMVLHKSQWDKAGKLGHFDDWPQSINFHREMLIEQYKKNRLRLFRLIADDKNISFRYIYHFGNIYHSFLPARLTGIPWDKLGIGRVTHILTVQKAIEERVNIFDAGRGLYMHKLNLGGETLNTIVLRVITEKLRSRVKVAFLIKLSKIINLLYYRVWFNKISPRLPFKKHSLRELWIRTRI